MKPSSSAINGDDHHLEEDTQQTTTSGLDESSKIDDPVGTHMVKILNSGRLPGFSPLWAPPRNEQIHSQSSITCGQNSITPLLSFKNYYRLRRLLKFILNFIKRNFVTRKKRKCNVWTNTNFESL